MTFIRRNLRPGLRTNRIEAFSDGVFAIAITILVLELAVPHVMHEELLPSLINLWPKFLSYFISFAIIGILWVGHVIMFRFIKRSDRVLLWLNILLLLFISFIPFPAALLGDYGASKYAVILYGLNLVLVGITYVSVWIYSSRNYRLIDKKVSPEMIKRGTYIIAAAPITYFIAIVIAHFNPVITMIIYILIPIAYIIPSPIDEFVDYAFEENAG